MGYSQRAVYQRLSSGKLKLLRAVNYVKEQIRDTERGQSVTVLSRSIKLLRAVQYKRET
jgi:hypothetical protein